MVQQKKIKKKNKIIQEQKKNIQPKKEKRNRFLWFEKNGKLLSYFVLACIFLFGAFLRFEDFSVWKESKKQFQYKGEYQMAEADSYYYLQLTKDIEQGKYRSLDTMRRVPDGVKQSAIPPLMPVIATMISNITHLPRATVSIFTPVICASLLAVIIFFICISLGLNRIASLSASLFSIVSLTYVVRTRIGVFDTDSMNVNFLLLNSFLFYQFGKNSKHRYLYLIAGIVSTLLAMLWWNTAQEIVLFSSAIPLCIAIWFLYKKTHPKLSYAIIGAVLLLSTIFLRTQFVDYFTLLFGKTQQLFPTNFNIGELDKVDLSSFINKTVGNNFIFILMLLGLVYFVWKMKYKTLYFIIPILIGFSPFVTGNRFLIFTAALLAIGIGFAIHFLFQWKKINYYVAIAITLFITVLGVGANYTKITENVTPTLASENVELLDALEKFTPANAKIWTDADIGYQVRYYLDRATFADGEFSDGELRYYLYFPLAAAKPALAANFINFYSEQGMKGMQELYKLFPDVNNTFIFLKEILSLNPTEAEEILKQKIAAGKLPTSKKLSDTKQWLTFLYPKSTKDVYLFLYYKMSQTATWFKQGNADLKTGETIGLPLFLTFMGLDYQNGIILNNQIRVNTATGESIYMGKSNQYFRSITTCDAENTDVKTFPNPTNETDKRFVFEWNKTNGLGAAMSYELANTTFVKLYLQNIKTSYFEPVLLQSPYAQIWKIHSDHYASK